MSYVWYPWDFLNITVAPNPIGLCLPYFTSFILFDYFQILFYLTNEVTFCAKLARQWKIFLIYLKKWMPFCKIKILKLRFEIFAPNLISYQSLHSMCGFGFKTIWRVYYLWRKCNNDYSKQYLCIGVLAHKPSYIFQHIGTRTFKFVLLYADDCLENICNYKFDMFFFANRYIPYIHLRDFPLEQSLYSKGQV